MYNKVIISAEGVFVNVKGNLTMKKDRAIFYIILPVGTLLIFLLMMVGMYIHNSGFADPSHSGPDETAKLDGGTVNINIATAEELDALPGIGPVIASRIIEYREANGPFTDLYSLSQVKGIGAQTIINLLEYIVLEDPT